MITVCVCVCVSPSLLISWRHFSHYQILFDVFVSWWLTASAAVMLQTQCLWRRCTCFRMCWSFLRTVFTLIYTVNEPEVGHSRWKHDYSFMFFCICSCNCGFSRLKVLVLEVFAYAEAIENPWYWWHGEQTNSRTSALAVSQRDWRFGALYLSNDIIQSNLKERKMADTSRGIVRRLI